MFAKLRLEVLTVSHRHTRRPILVSLVLFALALSCSTVSAQTWTRDLAQGITFTQKVIASPQPEVINILTVDPKVPGVHIQSVLAQDCVYNDDPNKGNEVVGSMAKRLNAAAVVNADFFPMGTNMPGDPLNLQVMNGELVSEPSERIVFGITSGGRFIFDRLTFDAKITLSDGEWFPIRGINRGRADNEMVAYTSRFADTTRTSNAGSEAIVKCESMPVNLGVPIKGVVCEVRSKAGNTAILEDCVVLSGAGTGSKFIEENLKPGISVTLEFQVKGSRTGTWQKVSDAVGGCPWLVRDGKQFIDVKDEGAGESFSTTSHPRTAVGVTKDGKLILVTVDGRQSISGGMTLAQLADVMLSQGCVEAANLDGGGSTTMATAFGILNSPSSGIQRAVANGLAVFGNPASSSDVEFTVPAPSPVPSGTTTQLCLLDSSTGQPLNADVANRAIWSTTGGMGFVDQSGKFYGVKVRSGNLIVRLGSKTVSVPVQTIPGPPADLSADLKADPSGAPNRGILAASVTDLNGNSIEGAQISLKVTGGTADQATLTTGNDGRASTGVTWDETPGAQVEVTCGSLTATAKLQRDPG